MDASQAKELLLFHSFSHSDINHPKMETGFLGSLRPYSGLQESNFHEVMQAIIALAPNLQNDEVLDREIVCALWAICDLARAWGVHPNGMLRKNQLITLQDSARLEQWVNAISSAVFFLLDGADLETALDGYQTNTAWDN